MHAKKMRITFYYCIRFKSTIIFKYSSFYNCSFLIFYSRPKQSDSRPAFGPCAPRAGFLLMSACPGTGVTVMRDEEQPMVRSRRGLCPAAMQSLSDGNSGRPEGRPLPNAW